MKQVLDDRRFRALVLDIDSGGGGASASDYIYRAVRRVADRKPVVANIRGIGASGGYMIACAAHTIVAAPGSIVGSIGVISVRPALEQLLEKAGIGVNVNKSGRFKDLGAPWRETTPEEEEKLQQLIDGTYDSFIDIVSERRGLDESRVREIATGEVYLAQRALEVGLVDEVGDLEHALDLAAKGSGRPKATRLSAPQAQPARPHLPPPGRQPGRLRLRPRRTPPLAKPPLDLDSDWHSDRRAIPFRTVQPRKLALDSPYQVN